MFVDDPAGISCIRLRVKEMKKRVRDDTAYEPRKKQHIIQSVKYCSPEEGTQIEWTNVKAGTRMRIDHFHSLKRRYCMLHYWTLEKKASNGSGSDSSDWKKYQSIEVMYGIYGRTFRDLDSIEISQKTRTSVGDEELTITFYEDGTRSQRARLYRSCQCLYSIDKEEYQERPRLSRDESLSSRGGRARFWFHVWRYKVILRKRRRKNVQPFLNAYIIPDLQPLVLGYVS